MSEDRPGVPNGDFEDLFENAPCGYIVMAPDGRTARVNNTFCLWTGLSREQVIGKHFRDLLSLPGRIFYETNLVTVLRLQGGVEEVLLELMTASGVKLPVLVNAMERRDDDGGLAAIHVALFRARERRSYERDLRGREAEAVQRLQDEKSVAELREQFIAVLGHDLRNPLAAILGAVQLLRRETQSERALLLLQMMQSSADRMAGLIDDVMDFARGRLGSDIHLDTRVMPLEPVLRHVVAELEANEPSRVIAGEFDLPQPVRFDENRLGQLVSNLLSNALTHGDPTQPVRLRALTEDGQLVLWVANKGEPIPPAARERLFQPFFRGDVRSSQDGLGLGLHIALEIARAHGGMLEVQSDEIETRFTFRMPLA